MPIKPENRKRYPKDWKAISKRIRFERAGGKCEWCGASHRSYGYRDAEGAYHMLANDESKLGMEAEAIALIDEEKIIRIILTVAHLNHDPTDNRDENLKALCQRCHLRYDAKLHQAEAAKTREAKREAKARAAKQAIMEFESK